MPDWFRTGVDGADLLSHLEVPITRVLLSAVAGFIAAFLYAVTFGRRRKDSRSLSTTLVLLSVLVAVVTQVIGDNTARAFGLVGALSIVRFRTVVEDTADTAFVIFAVTLGMAVGAGFAVLAAVCIPVVAVVAVTMGGYERRRGGGPASVLTVRFALGFDPTSVLQPYFDRHLTSVRLTGSGTAKQGAAVELVYAVKVREPAAGFALVSELNKVEGVQGVELKQC